MPAGLYERLSCQTRLEAGEPRREDRHGLGNTKPETGAVSPPDGEGGTVSRDASPVELMQGFGLNCGMEFLLFFVLVYKEWLTNNGLLPRAVIGEQ